MLSALLVVLVGGETFLRAYYGFCDTVLMQESRYYEYIAQPSQRRFRFRRHVEYNSKSMRSPEPDSSAQKIMGFGDSILNGGVLVDQDSLATTIMSKHLSQSRGRKVQFLNVSSGSWGPDNCFAYLERHGDFKAKTFWLFVSSHDAYDSMNFEKTVDVVAGYPSRQYSFAWLELCNRYLLPALSSMLRANAASAAPRTLRINKQRDGDAFNPGFQRFVDYSRDNGVELKIYLHAELDELKLGGYNDHGLQIIKFAEERGVPLVKDLEHGLQETDFHDFIHLNDAGHKRMADIVLKNL